MIRIFTTFLMTLAMAASAAAQSPAPSCSVVPGWTQQGEVRTFIPDNLFDYMDGNAEGYIIYDFVKMTGITCQSGEDTLVIDFSEMESPELAYGIFSANRHPRFDVQKFGMSGQIMPRRATFAKGKYYIEIAANPAKDHSAVLEKFVKAFEEQVPGTTDLPEMVSWFPTDQMEEGSNRLVPQSVLGLRLLRRGYIANYDYGRAFIVKESGSDDAGAVMIKLKERLGETESADIADEAFSGSDRYLGRMLVIRKGGYLLGFAGLKEGQDGKAQAAALLANIP